MTIVTGRFKFLDIRHFLTPGTSYRNFLIAFGCKQKKSFFPYEYIDCLKRLKEKKLPPIECFYNSLKKEPLSQESYNELKKLWKEQKWTSLKSLLVYYNNADTAPGVEAVLKMIKFYQDRNVALFHDSYSVPGVTLFYLMQSKAEGAIFTLFKNNEDLYDLIKKSIVGGPSIIFKRLAIKGETQIRQFSLKEKALLCKRIVGMDCNSLYLSCLMGQLPCGFFIRWQKELNSNKDRFLKNESSLGFRSKEAYYCLEWMSYRRGIKIRHIFNSATELHVGWRQIPVDGHVIGTDHIIQFHGCR